MLPEQDWLHVAKSVSVGQTRRVRHGRETRLNLVVGNDSDRWWAYCQSCKDGGVAEKTHVKLGAQFADKACSSVLPNDIQQVEAGRTWDRLYSFLASKNMDAEYFNGLSYSPSRHRLMLYCDGMWIGRDLTGKSQQKWMHYGDKHYASAPKTFNYNWSGDVAVVVEDPFSMYKVAWATRHDANILVFCSYGTTVHRSLVLQLLEANTNVVVMYDGDSAGCAGAVKVRRGLSPFIQCKLACAPLGLDPKDMLLDDIVQHLDKVLRTFKPKE